MSCLAIPGGSEEVNCEPGLKDELCSTSIYEAPPGYQPECQDWPRRVSSCRGIPTELHSHPLHQPPPTLLSNASSKKYLLYKSHFLVSTNP